MPGAAGEIKMSASFKTTADRRCSVDSMTTKPTPMLLIPGAWMGAWIWNDTVARLREAGCPAHTLTLPGLGSDALAGELAAIGLADHVDATLRAAQAIGRPLTIVGHSYSGMIAGMVADRAPELVVHTVIVAGFYPRDGRCLLDDWGSDADERASERADIERAGMIWAAPPSEGLEADAGLDPEQARWLGRRLRPHPGRTVLDPASMQRSIADRSVTVVADVGDGDPRSTLPDDLARAEPDGWRFRSIPEGHWPMLGHPVELSDTLLEAATFAASGRNR